MLKRRRKFCFAAGMAAALLTLFGCKPGPTIPAPTSDPTEIVQAHLAALNSKDPAKIHDFVTNYCVPAMQPVERIMLQIGKDSAPFTFQKLDSGSKERIIAEVTNGDGVHEFLSVKLGPNSKITSLLLGPPLLTDDQAAEMTKAGLAAVNSQDPAKIHAFFDQFADGPMGYLEK